MAITNLTNTTWIFTQPNSTNIYSATTWNIDFTSNGENFTSFNLGNYRGSTSFNYDDIPACSWGSFTNENYKTIKITGGADVENSTFIAWLERVARQEVEPPTFRETKTALKIYEDLTQLEFGSIEKDENSFYLVNEVGLYKGEKIIAEINAQEKLVSGENIVKLNGCSLLMTGELWTYGTHSIATHTLIDTFTPDRLTITASVFDYIQIKGLYLCFKSTDQTLSSNIFINTGFTIHLPSPTNISLPSVFSIPYIHETINDQEIEINNLCLKMSYLYNQGIFRIQLIENVKGVDVITNFGTCEVYAIK